MIRLYIFDWDGTLTVNRASSLDDDPIVPLPGTQAKLRELIENGAIIAVASNQRGLSLFRHEHMPQAVFDRRVRELRDLFPQIGLLAYAVDDGERIKPAPGMLLELMHAYGDVCPSRTLFVGDADTDRQAAEAAGCHFEWA